MSINIKAPLTPQNQEEEPKLQVEIVETVEAEPAPKPVQKPETEAEEYSERVQKRIKHLTWQTHEKERAAEAAFRERDEAITIAKKLLDENQSLKKNQGTTAQAYVSEAEKRAQAELDSGKRALKEAFEASDGEKLATAQEQISRATTSLMMAQQQKVNLDQHQAQEKAWNEQQAQKAQQQQRQPQKVELPPVDKRSAAWLAENPWFTNDDNMSIAMRAYAMNVHDKLASEGVEVGSDDYYGAIDKEMSERWGDQLGERKPPPRQVQTPKPAAVVVGAQRTSAAAPPRKVKLSETQVALARKLNLTNEEYAAAWLKENPNG